MRKLIKKALVFTMAGVMAISTAVTSFAATGWQYDNTIQNWQYFEYDEPVVDEWQKSGDHVFYLNEDGVMEISTVVENDNGTLSYVNSEGAKVSN